MKRSDAGLRAIAMLALVAFVGFSLLLGARRLGHAGGAALRAAVLLAGRAGARSLPRPVGRAATSGCRSAIL